MTPRVLAAVSRGLAPRIRAILPECEVCFVRTGAQLVRALDDSRWDMLIVGMHFDESSAIAALERVLARDETFPVVCVRGVPFDRLGQPALHALRMALGELGAQNFIDLLEYPDDALGNARVRAMLERLLSQPQDHSSPP
jgi:hypothetical protein